MLLSFSEIIVVIFRNEMKDSHGLGRSISADAHEFAEKGREIIKKKKKKNDQKRRRKRGKKHRPSRGFTKPTNRRPETIEFSGAEGGAEKAQLIGPRRPARSAVSGLGLHVKNGRPSAKLRPFLGTRARIAPCAPQPAHRGGAIRGPADTIFSDAIIPALKHRIPSELRS